MDNTVPRSGRVTIGIVAGEASGDALAATLIHAVRARMPQVRFVGVAGPRMEAAGCEAWFPLETLAVRGFAEVLSRLPQLFALRRALFQRLVAERVPVFVGVDAPDFNLGLEARLKRAGVRTLHFVSPSVWAWRRERVHRIGRSVHRMLALFPFEPPIYETAGVPVYRTRYLWLAVCGLLAGLGGATLSAGEVGYFTLNMSAGRGFMALAIVVLGGWDPMRALAAALLFGAADALQRSLQAVGLGLPPQLMLSVPYLLPILALALASPRARGPAALAVPYRKEER